MRKTTLFSVAMAALITGSLTTGAGEIETSSRIGVPPPRPDANPRIQLAILLDTSGSMSGLIDQARSELWRIVNELSTAKQDGKRPDFELALYEYGKSTLSADGGYLRRIVPFTTDLDKISEELFALKTNGGEEYCGWVIQSAARELRWSDSHNDLKLIFIAGNEPFTQGPIDYRSACKEAISRGIIVNTIHCGAHGQGLATQWKDGALLADGNYLNIDQNRKVVHIPAPQDKEITRLGVEINKTYVAYGALGIVNSERQSAQDGNANKVGIGSSVQRAACKASHLYTNAAWDLVDAVREKKVTLDKIDKKDLPSEMRKMNVREQRTYLEQKAQERKGIQERIQRLHRARQEYVALERKKRTETGDESLDSAIIKCIRVQAATKRIELAHPVR